MASKYIIFIENRVQTETKLNKITQEKQRAENGSRFIYIQKRYLEFVEP